MSSRAPGSPIDVAEVIQDARRGNLELALREERSSYDAIANATNRLFDMLEERRISYALVGGLAVIHYVAGRSTGDVDIVMAVKDFERLPELRPFVENADFVRTELLGTTIDVLFTRNKFFDLVLRNYGTVISLAGRDVPSVTPTGLILMKLYALPSLYRQGRLDRIGVYENDVLQLVALVRPETERLLAVLSPYMLATDIGALRDILREIDGRVARADASRAGPGAAPATDLVIP